MDVKHIISSLDKDVTLVHISKWAVTVKKYSYIYKILLKDEPARIHKEFLLLKMNPLLNAALMKTDNIGYIRTNYVETQEIVSKECAEKLTVDLLNFLDSFRKTNIECDMENWMEGTCEFMCAEIERYCPEYTDATDILKMLVPCQLIHGDFLLQNVKYGPDGNLIVFDFEDAGYGPMLWDETTLVFSMIENGYCTLAEEIYKKFCCDWAVLYAICVHRLARAIKKSEKVLERKKALEIIKSWRNEL